MYNGVPVTTVNTSNTKSP